ncbi:MAG: hypothetical protein HY904_10710 [Deltaproteobacteria bacterium]|nr:hypothetical protein [Deltaproteobacteria bacterium]
MHAITNVVALVACLVAILALGSVMLKLGGELGRMVRYIIVGIFLGVFVHAGVELAASFGLVQEQDLLRVMGVLLTAGAASFTMAGWVGFKATR